MFLVLGPGSVSFGEFSGIKSVFFVEGEYHGESTMIHFSSQSESMYIDISILLAPKPQFKLVGMKVPVRLLLTEILIILAIKILVP